MIHRRLVLALAVAVSPLVACAGATEETDESDMSEDALTAAASKWVGSYTHADPRGGYLRSLDLTQVKVGGKTKNTFMAWRTIRSQCQGAICPSIPIRGTWFVDSKKFYLYPEGSEALSYRYATTPYGSVTLDNAVTRDRAELMKQAPIKDRIAKALKEAGIPDAKVTIKLEETRAQEAVMPGLVQFDEAFASALQSFLHDADSPESPLAILADRDAEDLPGACARGTNEQKLACVVNRPQTEIRLLNREERAEGGEDTKKYWIFSMSLPQLSDHGHWAVVERRRAEATYNYGFN